MEAISVALKPSEQVREDEEDDIFCKSLANEMRHITNPIIKLRLKRDLYNLVVDASIGNSQPQDGSVSGMLQNVNYTMYQYPGQF